MHTQVLHELDTTVTHNVPNGRQGEALLAASKPAQRCSYYLSNHNTSDVLLLNNS